MSKPSGSGRKKRVKSDFEIQLETMLREKKKMNGQPYSDQSIKTFINGLVKLSNNYLDEPMVDLKWLEDTKKIIDFIETAQNDQKKAYSLSSKLAFYQTIIICLAAGGVEDKVILQPYWDQRDIINIQRSQHYDEKKPFKTTNGDNQTKVLEGVTPQDIINMIDQMDALSFDEEGVLVNRKLFMISTIIRLHTEFPWRNDLADVKVIFPKTYEQKIKDGTDTEWNWLIIEPKRFVFIINKFKTNKKYNKIYAPVENIDVKRGIKFWLANAMGEEVDCCPLFTWHDNVPLTRNNISVLLSAETKKYLKKPISTTLLAKIFDETKSVEDMTIEDYMKMKKQCYMRGHSPLTRLTIYKNPKN